MKKKEPPEEARAKKIKAAVEKNFDASPVEYDSFEEKYGYFQNLAKELSLFCGIEDGMRVLDIGCGTGISSLVLGDLVGPNGVVIGIDLSREMIDKANKERNRRKAYHIQYVKCDADAASTKMDIVFDAALFNATIFLIPMTDRVLTAASDCIRPGGKVGFNFIRYEFRKDGRYFEMLEEENRPTLSPPLWDVDDLKNILVQVGLMKIKNDVRRTSQPLEVVKGFYLIPAMAASLFPKLPYPERKERIERMFADLEGKGIKEMEHEWERYYCVKPGMAD